MNLRRFRTWFGVWLIAFVHPGQAADLPTNLPPHPRLLFSQADLPGIKARAAGPCKRYFDSLKSQADGWLSREVKLPDRGGQWFHWYSCPKHGARLRTEGPTRHVCPVDQEVFTDEKSQQPAEGKCDAFIATNGFSAVMAEAGKIYDGVGFHRTIALLGTNLILFLDQVQSEKPHVYDLAYHNHGRLVPPDAHPFQPPDKPGYSYLRDKRAEVASTPIKLRFDLDGGKTVWWALAGGEPTTLITGTGVGRHTEDRVPLVIARREGKATAYLWCLSLGPGGDGLNLLSEEVKLPEGSRPEPGVAVGVRVKTGSETQVLLANPSGKPVMLGGQQVEGKVVLLTPRDAGLLHVVCAAR